MILPFLSYALRFRKIHIRRKIQELKGIKSKTHID